MLMEQHSNMATFTTTTFTEIMEKYICDIFKISGLRPHQKEGSRAIHEEKGVFVGTKTGSGT